MRTHESWTYIHAERAGMADTWSGLSANSGLIPLGVRFVCARHGRTHPGRRRADSAELLQGAGDGRLSIQRLRRPGRQAPRRARTGGARPPSPAPARTTTTNHPPAPVIAMLGEIVVHGEDIRRPLGLQRQCPEAALVAVADNYKKTNILIGSKRRITGLRLRATDCDWVYGDGPELSGPLISLILAMAGRSGARGDLAGEGVSVFATRA